MSDAAWEQLDIALRRRADAGRPVDFWLRDDDAVEPTAALDRLLGLTGAHGIPLALAVIPARAGAPLADRFRAATQATAVLHGWAHESHAAAQEKKQEFGAHRSREVMLAELAKGRARLRELFGPAFFPLFVPPWNRIDPALIPHLPEAGLVALSTFGPEKPSAVETINTHVDIIDWHGTRGGRDHSVLAEEILVQLDRIAATGRGAIGILTHHLVHDEAAWRFLERLFALTSRNPACRWCAVRDLVAGT